MKHVGQHLERGDKEENEDIELRQWMIPEGLVHRDKVKGEYKSMERQTTIDKATNDVNLEK